MSFRLRTTVEGLLATPEIAQLLADVTGFREVSERYAKLFEALPVQLTAHTRVTIDQTIAQVKRQSEALIDRLMQQVSVERQAVMRQSASVIDDVMQSISEERRVAVEQVMRGLDEERQVVLAQLQQGVAQERQALLSGLEQMLDRGTRHVEHWLTQGFVLLAALILLFFVVRLAYRYAADRPRGTPAWRWTACAGLGGLALLVVVTALVYVQGGLRPMAAAPEAPVPHERAAQRRDAAAGGQGVEAAPDTPPAIAAPAASPESGQPAQGTASPAKHYVVQQGDTLNRIARRVYGDVSPQAWKRLYDANKAVIGADPSQLRMGMRLTIPES
jgi:nucleoid-associated protein YgaU